MENKRNRKIHRLFAGMILLLAGFLPQQSKASHLMGVDINYECLNNCTIRVHLRAYRDCSGASSINPNNLTYILTSGTCTGTPTILGGGWSAQVTTEVTPICPGSSTRCTDPLATINGCQEYYWFADFDVCSGDVVGCIFQMQWSANARNGSITSGAANQTLFVNSTTLNTALPACNGSPFFNNPPVPYICVGQGYTFNQGATDPEGDSLSYSIGPCFQSNGGQIGYNGGGGYAPATPLGSSWDVQINPATGDITLTPQPGDPIVAVLCVYVTEWRNGLAINTIVRDMQVTAIPCPNNTLPTASGGTNVTGGTGVGFNFTTCVGTQLCFDIPAVDLDSGQVITMFWDQNLASTGATFVDATNAFIVDTVVGANPTAHFCWTPPASGTFYFLVTVQDNACPIIGQNQYTFSIIVGDLSMTVQDSALGCGLGALCAQPTSGIFPFTYLWQGAGGLSANPNNIDSCLVHAYPGPGDFPFSITITDSTGQCSGTFFDTITIPTLQVNAGPDQAFCSGDSVLLGTGASPDVVYVWSPASGLSTPNSSQTNVALVNLGGSPLLVTYTLTATDTTTGCVATDQVVVTVNPIPSSLFSLPSEVCVGSQVQVTYAGWNGPAASYQWNFGVAATPATGATQGPFNVSWSSGGVKGVSLTVSELGCTSSISIDSITVWAIPVANIGPIADQCIQINSFDFTAVGAFGGTASFNWNFYQGANPNSSNAQNPTGIVWNQPGVKLATLQITEHNCVSPIDSVTFTIWPQPNALWTNVSGAQCFTGNNYTFAATGINGVTATYSWDFGNAAPATSTLQNPTGISFNASGQQLVTLLVSENGCLDTLTAPVMVNPNPVVDAGPDVSFCQGSGGTQLFGAGMGGTPVPPGNSYYWTWWCDSSATWCGLDSVFDNDPIANPNVSTMFYTQIVDFNGCVSNIDSAFVTVIPKPVVNAGPDVYICSDSAPCVILAPSISNSAGPFSYLWTPSIGLNNDTIANPCARPDTTTIYTLFVTDLGTGCNSGLTTVDTNSSVTVHVQPLPVAVAGPDVDICLGDSVMLQGYGISAGPVYDFQWSPNNGVNNVNLANPTVSPSATTEYVLVVWSNSCPSIGDTVKVSVHTIPTVNAGPDVEICLGETAFLDAQASGDPLSTSYSYSWTPVTGVIGSPNLEDIYTSPVSTTTYSVVATSIFGCGSAQDDATVWLKSTPVADAGSPITLCKGDTVQLDGGYFYTTTVPAPDPSQVYLNWTPGTNLSNPGIADPNVWPENSMYYYLTATYNTCVTIDSVLISVSPTPDAWVAADTTVICDEDTLLLTAGGGTVGQVIEWSPLGVNGDSVWVSPSVTTTYTVNVKEGQCSDEASITVQVLPRPDVAYMSSMTSGCVPFEVSFLDLSVDALQYIWNFGDGTVSNEPNPLHTYSSPGVYNVSLTAVSEGGCSDKVSTLNITVHDTAFADFRSNPTYPVEMSLPNTHVSFFDQSSNAVSWFWNFGDGITSDVTNPEHVFTEPGQYTVMLSVTSDFGCLSRVSHGPYIVLNPELMIPNVFSPNGDGVNDIYLVKYSGSQPFELNIFDRWGILVFSQRDKHSGWDGKVKAEGAPDGVYFYTVKIADKEYSGNVTLVR